MLLKTRLLESPEQLQPYWRFWTEWAATPFQSPAWLMNWWSVYASDHKRLAVLLVERDDGRPVGLLPGMLQSSWFRGRSWRLLGSGRVCTDFQSLTGPSETASEAAAEIARWFLQQQQKLGWEYVELEGISRPGASIDEFVAHLARAGCRVHESALESTWRVDLSDGWQSFFSRLSKNQRRQNRNLLNRFDKSDQLTFHVADSSDTLPEALAWLARLHQLRWQAAGQEGCFSDPRFERFLFAACEELAQRSQASVVSLMQDGSPVAAQLFLSDDDGNVFQYQSGRDPRLDSMKVGRILNLVAIRDLCERGCPSLDYMRGDEIYKSKMQALPTTCLRVRAIAPANLPRLRHSALAAGAMLGNRTKSWLEQLRFPGPEATASKDS